MRTVIKKMKTLLVPQTPFKSRRSTKFKLIMAGFFAVLAFVVINAVVMTLYFNDNEYEYTIFSHSYIEAILPNQPLTSTLNTGVARIHDPSTASIEAGDYVVTQDIDDALIGGGHGFPLVSSVVSIDETQNTLRITYDNTTTLTVSQDALIGLYESESGMVGTYYYTSMFLRGYSLLMVSHIILLSGYYFVFIYDNPERFLPEKNQDDKSAIQ